MAVFQSIEPNRRKAPALFEARDVTGSWTRSDGYFCRTLKARDKVFGRNCQLVQKKGNRLRFNADKGAGQTAALRIR
jgi:hypothetical protein